MGVWFSQPLAFRRQLMLETCQRCRFERRVCAPGYLLFVRDGILLAQSFDAGNWRSLERRFLLQSISKSRRTCSKRHSVSQKKALWLSTLGQQTQVCSSFSGLIAAASQASSSTRRRASSMGEFLPTAGGSPGQFWVHRDRPMSGPMIRGGASKPG